MMAPCARSRGGRLALLVSQRQLVVSEVGAFLAGGGQRLFTPDG
jgi:hypothetical protein